jgi:hypothetical protein
MPAAGRLPPRFIGQGEAATSRLHNVVCSGGILAYSTSGVMVVLVNLCFWLGLMANSGFRGRMATPVLVGERRQGVP